MRKLFALIAGTIFLASCASPVVDVFGGVYGIITDVETGEPVRAASVVLSPGNIATVTGTDGYYEFVELEAGQYKLQVTASGYLVNTRQVTALAGMDVSCDLVLTPEKKIPGLVLSTNNLNFSTNYKELMLTLTNSGTAGDLSWNVSGLDAPWLKVTPASGMIPSGGSTSVKVTVDRDNMADSDYGITYFSIDANGNSTVLTVSVEKALGGGTGNGGDNGDDNGSDNGDDDQVKNPTAGLYAYFTFEENCDNAIDGAENGNAINSPVFTDGMNETKAIKFKSSANSFMTVPEPMIDEEAYTVSFWVKGLSDGHIFHVEGESNNSDMMIVKGGVLKYLQVMDDNAAFSHPSLDNEVFTHIAVTQKDRTAKLYINGKYIDVKSHNYGTYYTVGKGLKFILGGSVKPVSHRPEVLDGASMTIDNLRIYNKRELSAEEIGQIYEFEK